MNQIDIDKNNATHAFCSIFQFFPIFFYFFIYHVLPVHCSMSTTHVQYTQTTLVIFIYFLHILWHIKIAAFQINNKKCIDSLSLSLSMACRMQCIDKWMTENNRTFIFKQILVAFFRTAKEFTSSANSSARPSNVLDRAEACKAIFY